MSVVKDDIKCSICGKERATGHWMGKIDIYSCHFCAIEVLPKLIADATLGNAPNDKMPGRGQNVLESVAKNYWYAATCLGMRAPQDRPI